jgi:hypothetical protein
MTEHGKIEHSLPNGDVLVEDATRTRPEVEEAFREAEEAFEQEAREAYERLREAAAA